MKEISRRDFLKIVGVTGAALLASACSDEEDFPGKDPSENLPRLRRFQNVNIKTLINPDTGLLFTNKDVIIDTIDLWVARMYGPGSNYVDSHAKKSGFPYQTFRKEKPYAEIGPYKFTSAVFDEKYGIHKFRDNVLVVEETVGKKLTKWIELEYPKEAISGLQVVDGNHLLIAHTYLYEDSIRDLYSPNRGPDWYSKYRKFKIDAIKVG